MKYPKSLLLVALACIALPFALYAQSANNIAAASKTVQGPGATPEPALASVARGLIDQTGNVLLNCKDGTLKTTLSDGVTGKLLVAGSKTLTAASTVSFAPTASTSVFLLTPGEAETINAVTTNAIAGRVYYLRILTSGTTSRTLTFSTNFKTTGTLATGTTDAKTFVISFLFDGTNFCEVSRTTAM